MFQCVICQNSYCSRRSLERHRREHFRPWPICVRILEKGVDERRRLHQHLRTHHSKKLSCLNGDGTAATQSASQSRERVAHLCPNKTISGLVSSSATCRLTIEPSIDVMHTTVREKNETDRSGGLLLSVFIYNPYTHLPYMLSGCRTGRKAGWHKQENHQNQLPPARTLVGHPPVT